MRRTKIEKACQSCHRPFFVKASENAQKCCSRPCRDANNRRQLYDDARRLKRCSKCSIWLPYSLFAANRKKTNAGVVLLQAYCTPCALAMNYAYKAAHPGKVRASRAKYATIHADEIRTRAKINRKRDAANIRARNRVQHVKRRGAGAAPHRYEIGELICIQDARCTYCCRILAEYHIDHKTPVSRGGSNHIGNLQLLCPTCNMKKGAMTHEEYLQRLRELGLNPNDAKFQSRLLGESLAA